MDEPTRLPPKDPPLFELPKERLELPELLLKERLGVLEGVPKERLLSLELLPKERLGVLDGLPKVRLLFLEALPNERLFPVWRSRVTVVRVLLWRVMLPKLCPRP